MQVNLGRECFFSVVRVSRWSCEVCSESEVSYLLIWKRKGCIHFLISIADDVFNWYKCSRGWSPTKVGVLYFLDPPVLCYVVTIEDKTNNLLNECNNNNIQLLLFSTSIYYTKTFCRKTNRSLYCQRPDFRIVSHPRLPGRPLGQILRLGNVLT